jgi:Protein of unknown function (DUF4058)
MPLLDHFHAPLVPLHPWESFHAFWASEIGAALNRLLPPRYFAVIHTHLGSRIEADVAEWELTEHTEDRLSGPFVFPDDIEVQVMDTRNGGAQLAGVLELISPANKDRPETRRAFAAKCAAYLSRGIGLIAIDIVTSHHFNLHNELIDLLSAGGQFLMAPEVFLSAVAYRPARRSEMNQVDIWPQPLAVGEPLPILPLALRGGAAVPVDLDTTYKEARERSRL